MTTPDCIVCLHMRACSDGGGDWPVAPAVYEGYSTDYGGIVGACAAHRSTLKGHMRIATLPERWHQLLGRPSRGRQP
jgi:hypothetical protein